MGPWCGPEVIGCDSSIEVAMKMLNVVGLGPPGFAAREERSCFSWHTAAGGPGGTWKFVERPSSEAGLEAFVSSAMDAAVKEVSAPREDRIHVARHTSADYDAYFRAWRSTTDARAALEENFAELTNFCARHEPITELCRMRATGAGERRIVGSSYHLLVLLFMQNGAALPPGMKEAIFLKTIEADKWASNPSAFARRCMMRKLRELVADYDERGGSAVEYRIPSFAEAKAEFWRVQAILCARGLGGAEERRVREQLEAKSVADNFDARVHRRSVGQRPPPKIYQCFRVAAIEAKGNYDLQEKQAALFGSHVPRQCLVPPKGSVPDREVDELDGQTLTGKAPRDLKRALGSFDPEQICAGCGKWDAGGGAVALKRCANCRAIFYCSPACQKKNWKMHKKVCKQLKAEREAARVADGIGQLRV